MKSKKRVYRRFIQRHWIVITMVVGLTALCAALLLWYTTASHQEITKMDAQTTQSIEEAKTLAAERAKAIAEAEEKARKEKEAALAKEAAEAAKQGGTATSIDATHCNHATTHNDPLLIDVLVNKKHCIQPLGFVPNNLVTSRGATLSAKAVEAYNALYDAAAAAGQGFYVTSSYRSYTTQIATYNRWVSISGEAGADTYSARPGYSEHQTGLAFDVGVSGCTLDCFGSTSQYQWLQAHAADYGFIQRYYAGSETVTGYKAEEWHYRYVGVTVARDMKAKGIKTLEQYWGIEGGNYY